MGPPNIFCLIAEEDGDRLATSEGLLPVLPIQLWQLEALCDACGHELFPDVMTLL